MSTPTSAVVGPPLEPIETPVPVVPAAKAHLPTATADEAADEAHVLPVGSDIKPTHQAEALHETDPKLVDAQVEKLVVQNEVDKGLPERGTVIPGIQDDRLWALRRRFDTQVTHTLSPPTKLPAGEPDLRPTTLPDVPFDSDVLKSNVERLYGTAGIWSIYAAREAMRLMSWDVQDRMRTAAFCAAYFTAWWFSLVLPLIFGTMIVLVMHTPSRYFLFPPIPPPRGQPPSATDPTNQRGDESQLLGVGHPVEHRSKAEQIEQQAWEFRNVIQRFGVRVVVGGHHKGRKTNGSVGRKEANEDDFDSDSSDDDDDGTVPLEDVGLPADVTEKGEKELTPKQKKTQKAKEAKAKRDAMVGKAARGVQDGLGDFADALERFANALSPPRPYPKNQARAKLSGAILLPILLATAVIPAHYWSQLFSFLFGVVFFAQPLLIRGAKKFVKAVPDWQEKIDMRNSIFSGVPTNTQLVLHILRVAEQSYDPLPPPPLPPAAHGKQELAKTGIDAEEAAVEANEDEAAQQTDTADSTAEAGSGGVTSAVAKTGKKTILGGLRLAAKKAATFKADVSVDGAKQKVGNKIDRFLYQSKAKDDETPQTYPAKLDGTSGHLVITVGPQSPPTLSFVPLRSIDNKPTFHEPINDLVEIKKRGVFIARAVLGWAASINLEGMGLEMRFKEHHERLADGIGQGDVPHEETHQGQLWSFSHVARRDQLFARLLSVGTQQWETL